MKIKNENKNPQTFTNVDDQAFINTNSQNSNQNLKSLENLKAQNLENSEAQDLNSYNIKNIDDALEKLNLKLQNKESRQELLNFLQSAEVYFISRQNKENPESFLDIGKIYEAAYVLGFLKDKKVVLNKYQEYCDVSIEKNKCNTYIEKFLLLDKNLK